MAWGQTLSQKDVILSKQGDYLFEQGRYIQSAQCYAQTNRSFEYVTLRFIDADERDALRIYLSERLNRLGKKVTRFGLDIWDILTLTEFTATHTTDDARHLASGDFPQQVECARRFTGDWVC